MAANIDLVVIYNNVYKPYLSIKVFDENKFDHEEFITFDENEMMGGLPRNKEILKAKIQAVIPNGYSKALLLLSCREVVDKSYVMPTMTLSKASKLYNNQLAIDFVNITEYYDLKFNYQTKKGYVFYDYLVPKKLVSFFTESFMDLGIDIPYFDLLGNYLVSVFEKPEEINNYALLYQEHEIVTLAAVYGNCVSSMVSFPSKLYMYNKMLYAYIDKHTYEREQQQCQIIYTNIDLRKVAGYENQVVNFGFNTLKYNGRRV